MFLGSLGRVQGNFRLSGVGAVGAPVRHIIIGPGDAGIYQTVRLIKQKVAEAVHQPSVVQAVKSILAGLPEGSSQAEIAQAFVKWFSANIRYRTDDDMSMTEDGLQWIHLSQCRGKYQRCEAVEMIYDAPQILAQRYGDCDDQVLLLGAFLQLAGIRWCPVVVALDSSMPREFSHIYLVANLDGSMVPIDTVNTGQPFGWEAESPFRREVLC